MYKFEDKDIDIIYLALGNLLQSYQLLLEEEKKLSEEERMMTTVIISRTLEILDRLQREMNTETEIQRPQWEMLDQH